MTEKPDQARLKRKKPSKNKLAIRVPISLHFYAVEIVVIILVVFIISAYFQSIMEKYIENECVSRINEAYKSTNTMTTEFKLQIDNPDESPDESIRQYLIKSISTSDDLSNKASIVLYNLIDKENGTFEILSPEARYAIKNASEIITHVIEEDGYKDSKIQTIEIDGNLIYYRSVFFNFKSKTAEDPQGGTSPVLSVTPAPSALTSGEEESTDLSEYLENYYLCIYVNSSSYYSFMTSITLALVQAALIAIFIAGILSVIMTYPIIFSSQKLSKFARRIAKGDFNPVRGHIVSKELSELGDVMNQMAYKLEVSDIEQKTFFQNASHELRTPLMSIQGYAEGLKYGVFESEEDRNNAIDVIIDETGRLSSLVENLLSISKMDMSRSGNYEVKKQNIDAIKICDTIIDKVRGNFIHEDKAIVNDIKLTSTYIYANENDLIRCLENIFANCLRYCKTSVTFRCNCDETGSNVIFEISDDGPGIAPEVLDHLFERFSKGSDGKHGIGLSLAKAIAEEHNGMIVAENKPEGGACFKIIIPVTFNKVQLTKMNNDSTT